MLEREAMEAALRACICRIDCIPGREMKSGKVFIQYVECGSGRVRRP